MSDITENRLRQIKSLTSHLARAGILPWLENKNVIEIMLNPDGRLWIEEFGKAMFYAGDVTPADAFIILRAIAHYHEDIIDREKPVLECELPTDGSRFEGIVPPLVENPSFTIRKKATKLFTLDDYVNAGSLTTVQHQALLRAVAGHKNILIAGGTGSGKTTFSNAMIAAMVDNNPDERVLIIEDTNEIQCSAQNSVIMRTSEQADIGMRHLLRVTLRYRPDRILIGEVRGGEALYLLKAWNTGHPGGLCTIHADSPLLALERVEQCIEEVSANVNRAMIASTIQMVVFIKKTAQGRRVDSIIEVIGYENNRYQFREI